MPPLSDEAVATGHVVLLHGLGRTRRSMERLARRLRREGFAATSIGYPSRRWPIERLAGLVAERLPGPGDGPLHFVTHSMGGIVLRQLVAARRPPHLGRAVMIAPPSAGSEVAARVARRRSGRWILGPAGRQLASGDGCLPVRLGPVDFEVGVITGDRPSPLLAWILGQPRQRPHDGKVAVAEARLEGMSDLLVVPRGHTFPMNAPEVMDATVRFLRHGCFQDTGPQGMERSVRT